MLLLPGVANGAVVAVPIATAVVTAVVAPMPVSPDASEARRVVRVAGAAASPEYEIVPAWPPPPIAS